MSIVRIDGVRREIGDFVILDSVSAAVARGERIGLVGPNGAGKTTLLEVVAGRETPDGGSVHVSRGTRIGVLAQEADIDRHFGEAASVYAYVRGGAAELERLERELADLETEGAEAVQSERYAELRQRFEVADGYHLDQRVEAALSGLGIAAAHWRRRPTGLSGGERTRVALARLLIADPDLMMLDEPTNHLDLAALEWLEQALARRPGALLVASHDRAFLDNVVERIWELRDRRLAAFRGGYSAYARQREAMDARARAAADETSRSITRETELVQRYRSQRKHVKMHEHERRLARLQVEQVDRPRRSPAFHLTTGLTGATAARSADVVISLEGVVCGYLPLPGPQAVFPVRGSEPETDAPWLGPTTEPPRPVARVERLEARRGERIGLVGPNGAGKSTLLRTIAGELPALEGFVRVGRNVMPGYLSQLRERALRGATVLDSLLAAAPVTPGAARSYLARFLFRGDEVEKPVSELSGGERSRLELALLGVGSVNLLLLDEPTNHLDIPSREALQSFLRASEATQIIVSHDRRLLEATCERLWVVEPRSDSHGPAVVAPFDGGYRDWRAAVSEGWTASGESARRPGRPAASERVDSGSGDGAARRRRGNGTDDGARARTAGGRDAGAGPPQGAEQRLSKDAYRRERARIEGDLARLEARKGALEAGLEDGAVQGNFVELRRITSELADVDEALGRAEETWLLLEERAPA